MAAKKASKAQLLARARFVARFGKAKRKGKKHAKRKAAKKPAKRKTARRGGTKRASYLAHKGKLYQCLGPIRRGCGGGAAVVVR
jgi:hypothetical protein